MRKNREAVVLCVGLDCGVLSTRSEFLRSTGFHVITALSQSQALLAVGFFQFQAAVLCHTLQGNGVDDLVRGIHAAQPGLAVVQLAVHDGDTEELAESVAALVADGTHMPAVHKPYLHRWMRGSGLTDAS